MDVLEQPVHNMDTNNRFPSPCENAQQQYCKKGLGVTIALEKAKKNGKSLTWWSLDKSERAGQRFSYGFTLTVVQIGKPRREITGDLKSGCVLLRNLTSFEEMYSVNQD